MNLTALKTVVSTLALVISLVVPTIAFTSPGGHYVPKAKPAPTTPSAFNSGGSPIDINHGGFFNNGTYGQRNADYDKWATSPTWAVGLSEMAYSFDQKEKFVTTLNERIQHFEHALWNYSQVTEISKPEGVAHAQKMIAELTPKIDRAREAWSKAKSSGRSDWEAAVGEAKKAFLDLQSFSYGLHKNFRSAKAP